MVSLTKSKFEKDNGVISTKFLGVYVNQYLSWKTHTKHLLNKLKCSLGAVSKVKPLLNRDTLLQLYHSLVSSNRFYCVQNWCYGNKTLCQKLQRVSNKFLRMAFGLGRRDSVKNAMVQHNLLNLDQMTVKATATFIFEKNAGLNPYAFNHLFLAKSYRYNTRNKSQVIPWCYSTKLNQQSISYRGPPIWNSLTVSIKDKKQSVKTFTKKLTNYLACNPISH